MINKMLQQIEAERRRQDAKFGVQAHLSVPNRARGNARTACDYTKIHSAQSYRDLYETLTGMGTLTWPVILMEEVAEAVESAATGTPNELKDELIQVAAVAVAWLEYLDREGDVIGTGVFRRVRPGSR